MREYQLMKRITDILKIAVQNGRGEGLGTVRDFLVGADGRIKYAILAHGGFLGVRDRLIPVPFDALVLKPERSMFLLDIDRQAFEMAPSFDPGKLPAYTEAEWEDNVDRYFETYVVSMTGRPAEEEGARITH
jgi:hypothetical protein